jgi:hypothetical protein
LGNGSAPPVVGRQQKIAEHRAREQLADLLLEEGEHSLERPTPEALTAELRELQLLALCAPVFV